MSGEGKRMRGRPVTGEREENGKRTEETGKKDRGDWEKDIGDR